ncbi:MAG: hypothetical protein PVG86_00295, partial [Desulfobacterales bacterium]
FPFFTIRDVKQPSPSRDGYLCKKCYEPYGLVLEKYSANLKKAGTDPKAAAWVALCYIMSAQRVNVVRTITAAMIGLTETHSSWEVCRQRAMDLAAAAMTMVSTDAEGQIFMNGLITMIENITESPHREIRIQRYASVMGDSIQDIEYEAVLRSGISMDELNHLVVSLPGHQWLLFHNP